MKIYQYQYHRLRKLANFVEDAYDIQSFIASLSSEMGEIDEDDFRPLTAD